MLHSNFQCIELLTSVVMYNLIKFETRRTILQSINIWRTIKEKNIMWSV